MKWYIPAWNGDIRVEAHPDDASKTILTVIDPTPYELQLLDKIVAQLREDQLVPKARWFGLVNKQPLWNPKGESHQETVLPVKVADLAPRLVSEYKGGDDTITAVVFRHKKIEVATGTGGEFKELVKKAEEQKAEKAVSTKRPTPCCPQCHAGPVDAATEVLLEFLSPDEHRQYAKAKAIVVKGGMTGHRYLLAHRHTPLAQRFGRMCFDLDDELVVHFHDTSVPPAEEILAAKLVLEHQEPWLRNQATMFGADGREPRHVFSNPFRGGGLDGVPDAVFTEQIGDTVARLLGMQPPRTLRRGNFWVS